VSPELDWFPLRGRETDRWRTRIYSSWERFIVEGRIPEDGSVRPFIIERWCAARDRGINPLLSAVPSSNENARFDRCSAKDSLVTAGARVFEDLAKPAAEEHQAVLLADANGCILHSAGDRRLLDDLDAVNARPGGIWDEGVAGPNGVGGPIISNAPLVIFGPEHFCEKWQKWICWGAPVHDPFSGRLVGTVDITGSADRPSGSQKLLALSLSRAIEYLLGEDRKAERLRLADRFRILAARYPSEPLGVFDRFAELVEASDSWHAMAVNERVVTLCAKAVADVVSGICVEEKQIALDGAKVDRIVVTPLGASGSIEGALVRLRLRQSPSHRETDLPPAFQSLRGSDPGFRKTLRIAARAAATDDPVLLIGETGVGKELVARAIHQSGARAAGPMVSVNCAALPHDLAEAELFGYAGGAFTGALRQGKSGRFQLADGGTLFLDEVGELPVGIQSKLLRVLEEGVVFPLGSVQPRSIDVRIVAATNRDLMRGITSNVFRRDLYYRLAVIEIELPPLRHRGQDALELLRAFLAATCERLGRRPLKLTASVEQCLLNYGWPGNVRELRNLAARLAALIDGDCVQVDDLPAALRDRGVGMAVSVEGSLQRAKEELVRQALDAHGGNVSAAARRLGVDRSTIYRMLRNH
jgi:transcriptional regulator of acetoin/glycerol metabolism